MRTSAVAVFLFIVGPLLVPAVLPTAQAQESFPFSPNTAELRLVTWNIENLGRRTPPRSDADLMLVAERIASFEAPVIALQEIGVGDSRPALEQILEHLGPSWRAVTNETSNGFVYEARVVELLQSEQMDQLLAPPYNNFYEDFPDWRSDFGPNGDPFTNARSLPMAAEFRLVGFGNARPIKVLSTHFHAGSEFSLQRQYEGRAIARWAGEVLEQESADSLIFVVGDFNEQPGSPAHTELAVELQLLDKENSQTTAILAPPGANANIDHIYASGSGVSFVSRAFAFVILPEHYGETAEEFEAVYSDHAPVMVDLSLASSLAYSGSWYDAERNGELIMLQVLADNRILVGWITYDQSGEQMWLSGVGELLGDIAFVDEMYLTSGGIFGTQTGLDAVELTLWGSLEISFETCLNGRLDYLSELGFGAGSLNLTRLTAIEGLACAHE